MFGSFLPSPWWLALPKSTRLTGADIVMESLHSLASYERRVRALGVKLTVTFESATPKKILRSIVTSCLQAPKKN
jgi:hypothetical protein